MVKWIGVAALMDAAIVLAFTGLPESRTAHLSCMLDTFTRFLLS
ncbi:MAG: hypothetical protein V8Q21_04805 [Akkermansia muciniphila]